MKISGFKAETDKDDEFGPKPPKPLEHLPVNEVAGTVDISKAEVGTPVKHVFAEK